MVESSGSSRAWRRLFGRLMSLASAALLAADLRFPPDPFKDWDEFYLSDPDNAIKLTNSWLEEK